MENKTHPCPTVNCGNICEVKTSTGHNNIANKGKRYIVCVKCDKFTGIDEFAPAKNTAPAPESPAEEKPTQEYWDSRNGSIVTQHSQEMALRFSGLVTLKGNAKEKLLWLSQVTQYFKAEAEGDKVKAVEILNNLKEPDEIPF